KSAEARSIEGWEGEIERAARGQQPYFVAVPHRADGAEHLAALRVGLGNHQMNYAGAEVEAVQQDVNRDHRRDQTVPDGFHRGLSSVVSVHRSVRRGARLGPAPPPPAPAPLDPAHSIGDADAGT